MLLLVLIQNSRIIYYNTNILASPNHHISININISTIIITNTSIHINANFSISISTPTNTNTHILIWRLMNIITNILILILF